MRQKSVKGFTKHSKLIMVYKTFWERVVINNKRQKNAKKAKYEGYAFKKSIQKL